MMTYVCTGAKKRLYEIKTPSRKVLAGKRRERRRRKKAFRNIEVKR